MVSYNVVYILSRRKNEKIKKAVKQAQTEAYSLYYVDNPRVQKLADYPAFAHSRNHNTDPYLGRPSFVFYFRLGMGIGSGHYRRYILGRTVFSVLGGVHNRHPWHQEAYRKDISAKNISQRQKRQIRSQIEERSDSLFVSLVV